MTAIATVDSGLARRRLGTGSLTFFLISASAPMTVLAGSVIATFAVTGNIGTPLSFAVLAIALELFSVGYATMSRYVVGTGGFYTYLARGLGSAWGVAGSFVALLAYSAIQICLFGLFGVVVRAFVDRHFQSSWPWWVWSFLALAVIAVLGVRKVDLNAKVLSTLLAGEVCAVLVFDLGSFTHPYGGSISLAGLAPNSLLVPGIGAVFAFGIAAYLGFEQGPVFSEESKDPKRTVARATHVAIAVLGVLYTVSAWALTVGAGADNVIAQARAPNADIPFSLIAAHFGPMVAIVANALLITSVFASMLSFHNCVARYVFAMSRDGILPSRLAHTGKGSAAPVAGSLVQTVVAAVAVLIFAGFDRDPITELFTWASYVGSVGVLLLMIGASLSVIGFFRRVSHPGVSSWRRLVAPGLAALALFAIGTITVTNAWALLGTARGSVFIYILPGVVAVAAIGGLAWGLALRATKPESYAMIGQGIGRLSDAEANIASTEANIASAEANTASAEANIASRHEASDESAAAILRGSVGSHHTAPVARHAPGSARPWAAARLPPAGRRAPATGVRGLYHRLRALDTIRRLRPLWRAIHAVVPEIALLPQYQGFGALRSTVRHAPLAVIRLPVEILDGCVALTPWMSAEALRVARLRAQEEGLTGTGFAVAVDAAVLATALYARRHGLPPAADPAPRSALALVSADGSRDTTVVWLSRVGRALQRSRIVSATLAEVTGSRPERRLGVIRWR